MAAILSESQTVDEFDCLVMCNFNDECFSMSYSPTTKKCLLSKTDFLKENVTPENEAGSVIYNLV
jgi:hypothetical protein